MEKEVVVYYGMDLAKGPDYTAYYKWDGKKVYVIDEIEYNKLMSWQRLKERVYGKHNS